MNTGGMSVQTAGLSDIEIVKTFMQDVDVVSSVRKLNSVEDYLELLELFYVDGERKAAMLPELLQKQDMERYIIEVHGLKSAAANIGAGGLSGLARQHEEAGKADREDWIIKNTVSLKESYQKILEEIHRVLKSWQYGSFAVVQDVHLIPIQEDELTARLEKALGSLEDFESKEAARQIEDLLGFSLPANVRTQLERVQAFLKVYEDDQAEELLRILVQ